MSGEKTKIKFHVVNSIKGGAGKSTFALMLANYLIKEKKETAYIVDLDLQGSSWEEDFGSFLQYKPLPKDKSVDTEISVSENIVKELVSTDSECKSIENESVNEEDKDNKRVSRLGANYLNDLMYDIDGNTIQKAVRYIRTTTTSVRDIVAPDNNEELYDIPVYIANPSIDRVDEVQADLFLNAIYKLIEKIEVKHKNEHINIVFDMPPSKDKYAEKVLTHLLLDLNSPLFKKISGDFSYEVELYMLTNLTKSHSEKNIAYLKSLVRNRSFSETMVEFIKKDCFKLYFIYNDVSGILQLVNKVNGTKVPVETNKIGSKEILDNERLCKEIQDQLISIPFSTQGDRKKYIKIGVLNHLDFLYKDQILDRIGYNEHADVKCLLMDNSSCDAFKKLMENGIDTDKK